jgi:SAM-dependent methyltransferase
MSSLVGHEDPSEKPLFDIDDIFDVDDYLYFYEESLTDQRSDTEIAWWAQALGLDRPMRILDVPCGYGRHTNRLAALGYSMTGVDISAGFLNLARQQAAEQGLRVDYRQGDMRALPFNEEFDRAIMLFTSLGYFEDAGNLATLKSVARALRPGGLLGFDIPNRDSRANAPATVHVTDKEGNLMVDRVSFDMLTGRLHNQRIIIRNGVRKDKPFSVRLYNSTEIRDLVRQAGMEVRAMYGDHGQPLQSGAWRLLVIAAKPGDGESPAI